MGSNAALVSRFYDAFNRRDWSALQGMLSPRVAWFHAARGELVRGPESVVSLVRGAADAYPQAKIDIRKMHESGGFVIAECAFRLPMVTPSPEATFCEVLQVAETGIVRGSTYSDTLQILLELECRRAA